MTSPSRLLCIVSTDYFALRLFCFIIRQHRRQITYVKLQVDGLKFHYRRPHAAVRRFCTVGLSLADNFGLFIAKVSLAVPLLLLKLLKFLVQIGQREAATSTPRPIQTPQQSNIMDAPVSSSLTVAPPINPERVTSLPPSHLKEPVCCFVVILKIIIRSTIVWPIASTGQGHTCRISVNGEGSLPSKIGK